MKMRLKDRRNKMKMSLKDRRNKMNTRLKDRRNKMNMRLEDRRNRMKTTICQWAKEPAKRVNHRSQGRVRGGCVQIEMAVFIGVQVCHRTARQPGYSWGSPSVAGLGRCTSSICTQPQRQSVDLGFERQA